MQFVRVNKKKLFRLSVLIWSQLSAGFGTLTARNSYSVDNYWGNFSLPEEHDVGEEAHATNYKQREMVRRRDGAPRPSHQGVEKVSQKHTIHRIETKRNETGKRRQRENEKKEQHQLVSRGRRRGESDIDLRRSSLTSS